MNRKNISSLLFKSRYKFPWYEVRIVIKDYVNQISIIRDTNMASFISSPHFAETYPHDKILKIYE